jgi:hypothetical protein
VSLLHCWSAGFQFGCFCSKVSGCMECSTQLVGDSVPLTAFISVSKMGLVFKSQELVSRKRTVLSLSLVRYCNGSY